MSANVNKARRISALTILLLVSSFAGALSAAEAEAKESIWNKVKISTKWYLALDAGEKDSKSFNQARVGRGYVTLKFAPVKWFEPRVTFDSHQDASGDWKVRLKYLYGKFKIPMETAFLTNPGLEFGIVHTPWFDFEEHINWYRMQGTMFIERNKLLNSADLGITFGGLLGKKLSPEYRERVNPKYPGSWGSFALGVYNGGGYHAAETNQNKVFQARLSVRPVGFVLPGLQFSYLLIHGKGNTAAEPDWQVQDLMASYEHQYFVLTAQYALGKGNQKGDKIDADGRALDFDGFSVFGEIKLPWVNSTLIGRYDWFDWDTAGSAPVAKRLILGYAYHFLKHNFFLLSYDRVDSENDPADWTVSLTLQVAFPPK